MSEPKRPRRSRHFTPNPEANPELSKKISDMLASLENFANPTVVVGDGWAALAAVGFLATKPIGEGEAPANILWITHSGAHAMPPLPLLEAGVAAGAAEALADRLGLVFGSTQTGHYLREFRNRSFSRPAWHKSPTREMRKETREECVWGPEARILPLFETRFESSLAEWEAAIRDKLTWLPNVKILSGVPVEGFEFAEAEKDGEHSEAPAKSSQLVLATGAKLDFSRVVWADRWIGLGSIEGLPKGGALARNREPVGVLQAVFTHSQALVAQSMQEAFYGSLHKEAGEEMSRSVWGYFFDGGHKSVWTLFVTEEEGLDNHSIGKKYRRMKQALDKMFIGSEWLPEGAANFSATITHEQLLFQEDFLFARGETLNEPQRLGKGAVSQQLAFVTDAFGPSTALEQVARLVAEEVGLDLARFENPLAAAESVGEESGTKAQDEDSDPSRATGESA